VVIFKLQPLYPRNRLHRKVNKPQSRPRLGDVSQHALSHSGDQLVPPSNVNICCTVIVLFLIYSRYLNVRRLETEWLTTVPRVWIGYNFGLGTFPVLYLRMSGNCPFECAWLDHWRTWGQQWFVLLHSCRLTIDLDSKGVEVICHCLCMIHADDNGPYTCNDKH